MAQKDEPAQEEEERGIQEFLTGVMGLLECELGSSTMARSTCLLESGRPLTCHSGRMQGSRVTAPRMAQSRMRPSTSIPRSVRLDSSGDYLPGVVSRPPLPAVGT